MKLLQNLKCNHFLIFLYPIVKKVYWNILTNHGIKNAPIIESVNINAKNIDEIIPTIPYEMKIFE